MQGKTINGFELKSLLGKGGMAEVWYAENEIGKRAAVKILSANLSDNQQIVERFHNEALVMVKLEHPNIRQVYGYGYIGNRHCIVMEYLEGDDLEALLKNGRRFTDEELRRWWNETVDALNYTHAMGIVHRDIMPSNLFLDKRGNIKLLDFGIAKVKESISMTRTGALMGTLMYMSPEQVKDTKNIDYRTDVYSLAVTFAQLVSGKAPYDSDSSGDFEIREQIVYKALDLSGLPGKWRSFLTPYLAKDPDKRPALRPFEEMQPTNEHLAEKVQSVSKTDDVPKSDETPSESDQPSVEKKGKSKSKLWLALGAVALALIIGLGYLFFFNNNANRLYSRGMKTYEQGDREKGMKLMTQAAEMNHADAQYALATMYMDQGTASNYDEAEKWYRKAAEQGIVLAQTNLALLYEDHYGRYDEALKWYHVAAAQGDGFSQFKLGHLYETQYKDFRKASEWYKTAAGNGFQEASKKVEELENKMKGITVSVNGVSFVMIPVDGGTFLMGTNDSDASEFDRPVHSVTVSSFYLAETEVTQALWKAVMGNNPSHFKGDNLPVEQVSYDDCLKFIRKLNQLTGKNFRLPTEAEWEYAARGGRNNEYKYAGSNNINEVAWFFKNSGRKTHEVKTKSPNTLGLYDMSGNVWECCQDGHYSYSSDSQTNPIGAPNADLRIHRGGAWNFFEEHCPVWYRSSSGRAVRDYSAGLRLALPK